MIAHLALLCGLLLHGEMQLPAQPGTHLPAHLRTREFNSKTISVKLVGQGDEGLESDVWLAEHADADYVIVEAFYWVDTRFGRLMLHKEAATPVSKESIWGVDFDLPYKDIVFIRVKELKYQTENDFGDLPK